MKERSLITKLEESIRYAKSTCIIGASNKIEDIQKTNGWSYFVKNVRYSNPGHYQKWTTGFTLCLQQNNPKFEKSKIYLRKENHSIYYTFLNAEKKIISDVIHEQDILSTINQKNTEKKEQLKNLFTLSLTNIQQAYPFFDNILEVLLRRNHIHTYDQLSAYDKEINLNLNSDSLANFLDNPSRQSIDKQSFFYFPKKKWHYHVNFATNKIGDPKLKTLNPRFDPLSKLKIDQKIMFRDNRFTLEKLVGNCGNLNFLIARYLWENASPDIKKIEMISFDENQDDRHVEVDHCILLVNRQGDLNNFSTWGEQTYLIDPWAFEGIIFSFKGINPENMKRAFIEQYKKIMQFLNKQYDNLNLIFRNKPIYQIKIPHLYSELFILPQEKGDDYPFKYHHQVEDYYDIMNAYYTLPLTKKDSIILQSLLEDDNLLKKLFKENIFLREVIKDKLVFLLLNNKNFSRELLDSTALAKLMKDKKFSDDLIKDSKFIDKCINHPQFIVLIKEDGLIDKIIHDEQLLSQLIQSDTLLNAFAENNELIYQMIAQDKKEFKNKFSKCLDQLLWAQSQSVQKNEKTSSDNCLPSMRSL